MGRRIPIGDYYDVNLVHPVLSLSLQMAWFAATFAMISALCVRRKSSSAPKPSFEAGKSDDQLDKSPNGSPRDTGTMIKEESEEKTGNDMPQGEELPLPPAKKTLKATYSLNRLSRSMSMQRLESSLSMKMKRSMSLKDHDLKKKGIFSQKEESIWTKTIILGEKCKPDEDDTIIYDNKGNRISAYHKKTCSSNFSRANSHIDANAIPGQDKDKGVVRKDKDLFLQPNES